jgi:hypothetical protein
MKIITKQICKNSNPLKIVEYAKKNNYNLSLIELNLLLNAVCNLENIDAIYLFARDVKGLSDNDITYLINVLIDSFLLIDNQKLIDQKLIDFSIDVDNISINNYTKIINELCFNIDDGDIFVDYYIELKDKIGEDNKNLLLSKILKLKDASAIYDIVKEDEIRYNDIKRTRFTNAICDALKEIEISKKEYTDCSYKDKKEDTSIKIMNYYDLNEEVLNEKEKHNIIYTLIDYASIRVLDSFIVNKYENLNEEYFSKIVDRIYKYKTINDDLYNLIESIYIKLNDSDKKRIWWFMIYYKVDPKYIIKFILNIDNSLAFDNEFGIFKTVDEFINFIYKNINEDYEKKEMINDIVNPKMTNDKNMQNIYNKKKLNLILNKYI